jgi:hypothetical protein
MSGVIDLSGARPSDSFLGDFSNLLFLKAGGFLKPKGAEGKLELISDPTWRD